MNLRRIVRNLKDIPFHLYDTPLRIYQRLTRGFSHRELWSLDYTIVKFTLPRLKAFAKDPSGYPMGLNSHGEWEGILALIIHAMELYIKDMDGNILTDAEEEIRVMGMDLFHEYFGSLWN